MQADVERGSLSLSVSQAFAMVISCIAVDFLPAESKPALALRRWDGRGGEAAAAFCDLTGNTREMTGAALAEGEWVGGTSEREREREGEMKEASRG